MPPPLPLMREALSLTPGGEVSPRLRADDLNETLAWLDYCVASGRPFKQTVIQHLSKTRQKDFTWKQIDDKIKNLWNWGPNRYTTENSTHLSIYHRGTKAISILKLEHEARKALHRRVQQLQEEHALDSPSPGRKRRRRKRARRGAAVGHLDGRSSLRPISDTIEVSVPSRKVQGEGAVRVKTEVRSGPVSVMSRSVGPSQQRPTFDSQPASKPNTREVSATIPSISDSEDPGDSGFPTTPLAGRVCITATPFSNVGSQDVKPAIFFSPADEDQRMEILGPHEERESSVYACDECETTRKLLEDRDKDLQYVRGQLSDALEANMELRHRLQGAEHTRAIWLNAGDEAARSQLERYLTRVEDLTCQLKDKEALCPFTTRSSKKHIPFDEKYFQDEMVDIRNRLDDLLTCAETLRPCNDVRFDTLGEDLGLLAQRATTKSSKVVRAVSFHSLLQSLLSAAICEWVFESPVDEQVFTTTPLRETMLSHLRTQDGDAVVRNLDFAAHHTLIESPYYQDELIPRRAKALAIRASEMIQPLLGLQKSLGLWEVDILEMWTRQRPRLEDVFVSALKIKAKALVCKDIFEVIFPSPGDAFDGELMEEEKSIVGEKLDKTSCVQLCLVPGLRKFPFDRKLVDYNSFRKPQQFTDDASDLIAEAVVLVH
ncbi:hypothetical protein A1O3_09935 [Capronia epimyces CBS 606.96]|uniref:Uncharacterized protein n=1 Tax=Capronia epimyces CBS 606.96 TaxID=1182542 RepID=W9XL53_9EURO|nr:uncharacterized protein A1O3_09935 [Capronia epimyces CBS 606.96]EXJ77706.1 hypothetical protein A1O3_09935 [Capronia epimyces CBS 606.96]